MTAVAFERAVGSRWIVSVILAAALLSLFKVFNGNLVAASRLLFAMGRRGLVDAPGRPGSPAESDPFGRSDLRRIGHGCMHVSRATPSWCRFQKSARWRPRRDGWPPARRIIRWARPARPSGCRRRGAGRAADDPDESCSVRARALQWLRMAGPGNLGRAGCGISAAGKVCVAPASRRLLGGSLADLKFKIQERRKTRRTMECSTPKKMITRSHLSA